MERIHFTVFVGIRLVPGKAPRSSRLWFCRRHRSKMTVLGAHVDSQVTQNHC